LPLGFIPGTFLRVEFDSHETNCSNNKTGRQCLSQHRVKSEWPNSVSSGRATTRSFDISDANRESVVSWRAAHTVVSLALHRVSSVAKRHTLDYDLSMKYFSWNEEKNERLKRERNVSFEEVVFHIERGDLLDIVEHPHQESYQGQRLFIVNIEGYGYLVPFTESEEEVFLKTIIPSRKATKKYLQGKNK